VQGTNYEAHCVTFSSLLLPFCYVQTFSPSAPSSQHPRYITLNVKDNVSHRHKCKNQFTITRSEPTPYSSPFLFRQSDPHINNPPPLPNASAETLDNSQYPRRLTPEGQILTFYCEGDVCSDYIDDFTGKNKFKYIRIVQHTDITISNKILPGFQPRQVVKSR
jgi:hypothetical protein